MRSLKAWARKSLPSDSTLRRLILEEDNDLEVSDFLGRLPAWSALARFEQEGNTR